MTEDLISRFARLKNIFKKIDSKADYLTISAIMTGLLACLSVSLWSLLFRKWTLVLTGLLLALCILFLPRLSSNLPTGWARLLGFTTLLMMICILSLVDGFSSPIFYLGFTLALFPYQAYLEQKKLLILSLSLLTSFFLILSHLVLSSQVGQPMDPMHSYFNSGIVIIAILIMIVAIYSSKSKSDDRSLQDSIRDINLRYKNILRVACHDLSNPLTLVMGSALLAQTDSFKKNPEKTMIFWEKIEKAADQLNLIIANMRVFEAMQEPKRLVIREVKIIALIEEVCFSLQEKLQTRDLKLETDQQLPHDTRVMIDPHYFSINCLKKIMNNAIRYSNPGGTIHLKTFQQNQTIHIMVKDFGPGIDSDTLEKLFQFDFMKQKNINPGEKSIGFGLSVAKLLMIELGGDLAVKTTPRPLRNKGPEAISKNEAGTTIELYLPLNFTPTGKSRGLDGDPMVVA